MANHDRYVRSAEVCTRSPLDSIRRLRGRLSEEFASTLGSRYTYHTSTSASYQGQIPHNVLVPSQIPYGQWLYTKATSNIACLIFLSLDGAHCVQRVDTMTHPV